MELFVFNPKFDWGTVVQLLGFAGAIWGITYQLGKQRDLQKENHKIDLQTSVYESITTNMEGSSPTGHATKMFMVVAALDEARKKVTEERPYVPPPFKADELHEEFVEIHSKLWKVTSEIEKYEIVTPHLSIFREVFVIKLKELSNKYLPLVNTLPHILLSEDGISESEGLLVLDDGAVAILNEKVSEYSEIAFDIAAYLHDIQVELQNLLLGEVFGNRIAIRNPPDDQLVLTSSKPDMVKKAKDFIEASNAKELDDGNGT